MPCYQVDRKRKGSKEGRYNNKGYNEKGYKNNVGEGGSQTVIISNWFIYFYCRVQYY